MLVTLSGIVTLIMLLQPLNTPQSMLVTLSGIVTFTRFLQSSNAYLPMLVTLSGIVTLVMLLLLNAKTPMLVTPSGITRFFTGSPFKYRSYVLLKQSSPILILHQAAKSVMSTLLRLRHPLNALQPMLVTLSGIVMLVRLRQPLNAASAISFVPFLMLHSVIEVFALKRYLPQYKTPFSQFASLL